MYSRELLIAVSRDRAAAAEVVRWRAEAHNARPWQRRRRREAEGRAADAERRAVAAGIDWDRLPRPPSGLVAPDRSRRHRIGRRLPPPESPVPGTWRGMFRRTPSRAALSPPPAAIVPPDGGGVGALSGRPTPGEVTGAAAMRWLRSEPAAAHASADGSSWFQAADGSLWHRDSQGAHFALAADGASMLPLSDDGLLYAQDDAGVWHTSLADGTPITLSDDGQLVTHGSDGSLRLLADDGLLYLVAPGALYPIAEDGEILTTAGIDLNGLEIEPPDGAGLEGGFHGG